MNCDIWLEEVFLLENTGDWSDGILFVQEGNLRNLYIKIM